MNSTSRPEGRHTASPSGAVWVTDGCPSCGEFIGPELREAGLHFVRDDLVGPKDYPAFERAVGKLARRRESMTATLVLIALAEFGAWKFTLESVHATVVPGWETVDFTAGFLQHSLAGLW